jgi:hypothetical protein
MPGLLADTHATSCTCRFSHPSRRWDPSQLRYPGNRYHGPAGLHTQPASPPGPAWQGLTNLGNRCSNTTRPNRSHGGASWNLSILVPTRISDSSSDIQNGSPRLILDIHFGYAVTKCMPCSDHQVWKSISDIHTSLLLYSYRLPPRACGKLQFPAGQAAAARHPAR